MAAYIGMGEDNMGEELGSDRCGIGAVNKWTLLGINGLLLLCGVIIIVVAAAAKASSAVCTMPILGGVITMGVFLCILAWVGFFAVHGYPATRRPHTLNIYIVLMILLFVIHFSVSIAAVAVDDHYQREMMKEGWCDLDVRDQRSIQREFKCKGFDGNYSDTAHCNKASNATEYPSGTLEENHNCYDYLLEEINYALTLGGGISLGFCFLELVAVVLALFYRRKSRMLWAKEKGYTREML